MRVWIVTGCSTGFGREICLNALARGEKVVATCRGNAHERLADLEAKGATVLSLDVTADPEEIQAFAQRAIAVHGQVDILCNNAGYVQLGAWEEVSHEETLKQYQTNVFGTVNVTRAFLPHLRERKSGLIAVIGSWGAKWSRSGSGVYTSTKAAIQAFSRSLADEVKSFNIRVTCIEPSDFHTAVYAAPTHPATRLATYKEAIRRIEHVGPQWKQPGDPHKGAERIVDLLTGEGHAKGRILPVVVALGDGACQKVVDVAEEWGKEAKEWKEWSTGTDY